MSLYQFTVYLNGEGNNPEEAWEKAIEGFINDPGSCPERESELVMIHGAWLKEASYTIIENEEGENKS